MLDLRVRDVVARHSVGRRVQPLWLEPSRPCDVLAHGAAVVPRRQGCVGDARRFGVVARCGDRADCMGCVEARSTPPHARGTGCPGLGIRGDGAMGHVATMESTRCVSVLRAFRTARLGSRPERITLVAGCHVLAGSFLVQTHIGYLPFVVVGAGRVVVSTIATARSAPSPTRSWSDRRLWWTAAVVVVVWLPPIVQQLANGRDGNFARLFRYFALNQGTGRHSDCHEVLESSRPSFVFRLHGLEDHHRQTRCSARRSRSPGHGCSSSSVSLLSA